VETLAEVRSLAALLDIRLGRKEEAGKLLEEALPVARRALGEDHDETLKIAGALANVWAGHRRHREAEALFLDVIDRRRRLFGEDHPARLTALNNLSGLYHAQDRYDDGWTPVPDSGEPFSLIVGRGGTKTFYLFDKHRKRAAVPIKLGRFDKEKFGLKTARAEATRVAGEIVGGRNHLTERRADKRAALVTALANEYLTAYARKEKKASSAREDERMINTYLVPKFGTRKAKDVTRREAIRWLEKVEQERGPVQRNRLLALCSKMWNVGIDRQVEGVEANPFARIKMLAESPRTVEISNDELRWFWQAIPSLKGPPGAGLAIKLALVTGCRLAEVVQAPWAEFDLGQKIWVVPWQRRKVKMSQKRKVDHRVPLSPMAIEILKEIRKANPESTFLFPAPRAARKAEETAERPLDPKAVSRVPSLNRPDPDRLKARSRRRKPTPEAPPAPLADLEHIRVHDARHLVATHLGDLQFTEETIGRVLGHTADSVAGKVYDESKRDAERRTALEAWANVLTAIVTGTDLPQNVVSLRPAAASVAG
jgi:integrase